MIKSINISLTIGTSSRTELILTKAYFFQKNVNEYNNKIEKTHSIMDLAAGETHVISNEKTRQTIPTKPQFKKAWSSSLSSKLSSSTIIDEEVIYNGCNCLLLEEIHEIGGLPNIDSEKGDLEFVSYSYQSDLKDFGEYLELDEKHFEKLFFFERKIESHPYQLARWIEPEIGGKSYIGGKIEKIEFNVIPDVTFIHELLALKLK